MAKKTVVDNKCKSVLYIAGKENGYVTEERLKGIRRLAEEMDLELLVREGDFSERKAREITFHDAKEKDVLVCASDLMAIGAMRALTEMDIFRPVEELHYLLNGGEGRKRILDYQIVRMQYLDIIC